MDFESFFSGNPVHIAAMKVRSAQHYDTFAEGVYGLIYYAKNICQSSLDISYEQGKREDSITLNIKNYLFAFNANISMEHVNGNADFVIQDDNRQFRWIGEAKIIGDGYSNDHLFQGALQLSTRYSTGGSNEKHGGLLIYNFKGRMSDSVESWKEYFFRRAPLEDFDSIQEVSLPDFNCCDGFFSKHSHHATGNEYVVAHIPINFFHKPLDKSGVKSRKKSS